MDKLHFAKGNAKLDKDTAILSLPAGHTCMGAKDCQSFCHRVTGKITDGKHCKFRCFAVSSENLFPNVRKSRWANYALLLQAVTVEKMAELIHWSIPGWAKKVRFGGAGDFFNQNFFDACNAVALKNPGIIFYAYTKSIPFWVKRLGSIAPNFKIVASLGGKYDAMALEYALRSAKVVFSEEEAGVLPIDHDDTMVWRGTGNFALLLHGTQPKGFKAATELYKLRKQGKGGYKSDYFSHYKK